MRVNYAIVFVSDMKRAVSFLSRTSFDCRSGSSLQDGPSSRLMARRWRCTAGQDRARETRTSMRLEAAVRVSTFRVWMNSTRGWSSTACAARVSPERLSARGSPVCGTLTASSSPSARRSGKRAGTCTRNRSPHRRSACLPSSTRPAPSGSGGERLGRWCFPERGGVWTATWGESEDDPDYVTMATIREFEPPSRLVLSDYRYRARSGPLPFRADFVTEFLVAPHPEGSTLRVCQDGFPAGPEADEFYSECGDGWLNTFWGSEVSRATFVILLTARDTPRTVIRGRSGRF